MKDLMYDIILNILKTFRKDGYIEKKAIIHKFKTDRYMEGEGVLIKDIKFSDEKDYIIKVITQNVPEDYELAEVRRAKLIDAETFLAEIMYEHLNEKSKNTNITFEIGLLENKELNIALSNKPEKRKWNGL